MNNRKSLTRKLVSLQEQHGGTAAREYWQSLEELSGTEAFQELVRQEFPALADIWPDALNRRAFLGIIGASLALAGVGGCSVKPAPQGTIVPYVRSPEAIIPGTPLFFATTMVHGGDAVGLLVESHEGRPTKIEGNPDHPASLGATSIFHQASVLTLYDPARSQTVVEGDQIRDWYSADAAMAKVAAEQRARHGSGLRLLTENVLSPTLGRQIDSFLAEFPEARWHQYEPVNNATAFGASRSAFGRPLDPVYAFDRADVVLSLDADFLTAGPGHLRYAREFMKGRLVRTSESDAESAAMNRLYVVEAAVSCTGAKADHRLAVRMHDVESVARQLAAELGIIGSTGASDGIARWTAAVARDLKSHRGRSIVLAGPRQPPHVHLLAHAMNNYLGNYGATVRFIEPAAVRPLDPVESLRELTDDMDRGVVDAIFILGGNPVYTAPADLDFGTRLGKVRRRFHLGLYEDATSRLCSWHLPESHYLESWGDARAFDGTASIVQPLISPLYQGRSMLEVLAGLLGQPTLSGRDLVQSYWNEEWRRLGRTALELDALWQTALHDGVLAGTAHPIIEAELQSEWQSQLDSGDATARTAVSNQSFELVFQPDPSVYDGRYANNGWLQELPKPLTKLTWENAAILSVKTARDLGIEHQSFAHGGEHGGYEVPVVNLRLKGRNIEAPVWIMPGHADGTVTIYLGYGQEFAARAHGEWQPTLGFNAYALRTSENPWFADKLEITPRDRTQSLACTQAHFLIDDRDIIRSIPLADYQRAPHRAAEQEHQSHQATHERATPPATLYEPYDYDPPQRKWGMAINTTTCIGCNACVAACQAENNIPVVGKEQVLFGREMHWLRVDRYVHGDPNDPDRFYFQPVPCMHCEHAPCEYVCPVGATVHSADGLNEMIYNRCVGTRFCSNNCPYKVRRFNFLEFADFESMPLRMQYNPDVTVRSRGVMEKCTYCVQRIRQAEITAEAADRAIRDGEVLTACQAACPTQAIAFGDMNDPEAEVRALKNSPLNYGLLAELNTFPRTTYLAALSNPNPELES
jgi:molybdopterin-containing oxidoreductase family iron-sulfur binding subunit